jgi:hypothetical protein
MNSVAGSTSCTTVLPGVLKWSHMHTWTPPASDSTTSLPSVASSTEMKVWLHFDSVNHRMMRDTQDFGSVEKPMVILAMPGRLRATS